MKKLMLFLLLVSQNAVSMDQSGRQSQDQERRRKMSLANTMRVLKARSDSHLSVSRYPDTREEEADPDKIALEKAMQYFGMKEKDRKGMNAVLLGANLTKAFEHQNQRIQQLDAENNGLRIQIAAKDELLEKLIKQLEEAASSDQGADPDVVRQRVGAAVKYSRATLRRMKNRSADFEADGIPRDGSDTQLSATAVAERD